MSLKKDIVMRFSFLPEVKGLEKNKIVIITSLGIITGRFPTDEEVEDVNNSNAIFSKLSTTIVNDYKNELSLSETDKLPGDEGFLYLVDVEIKSPGNSYNLPFMIVFYDQIIGISIGNS